MNAYTEAEQIELLKKWWREYGTGAIVGIIIALLAGFGLRHVQQHYEQQRAHVSLRYEQLLTNVVNGNSVAVENNANRLIERYPDTVYTQLAALQLVRQDVYQANFDTALTKLKWIIKHGNNAALRQVARMRAARVLLSNQQPEQALKILTHLDDKAYEPIVLEVQGDIYAAQGAPEKARAAYTQALKVLPELAVMQPLLQMKLDNLTVSSAEKSA